jgi:hypothetical protein
MNSNGVIRAFWQARILRRREIHLIEPTDGRWRSRRNGIAADAAWMP